VTYLQQSRLFLPQGEGRPVPGPEGIVVKAGADDTGGVIAVLESTSAPGFGPPRHIHHSSDELFYILGGELDVLIGTDVVRTSAGSFVRIPRGTVHAPRAVGPEPAKVLIMFAPGGPDKVFDELAALAAELGGSLDPADPRIEAIVERHDSSFVGPPLEAR
jgi:quercetin dioxygenase-like cupin family protein